MWSSQLVSLHHLFVFNWLISDNHIGVHRLWSALRGLVLWIGSIQIKLKLMESCELLYSFSTFSHLHFISSSLFIFRRVSYCYKMFALQLYWCLNMGGEAQLKDSTNHQWFWGNVKNMHFKAQTSWKHPSCLGSIRGAVSITPESHDVLLPGRLDKGCFRNYAFLTLDLLFQEFSPCCRLKITFKS